MMEAVSAAPTVINFNTACKAYESLAQSAPDIARALVDACETMRLALQCTPVVQDGCVVFDCGDPVELLQAFLAKHDGERREG